MTSNQRVVVIGGGLAGLRLAARLTGAAEVTVLGEEPHVPYNRVLLAEVLAGRYAPEVTALPAPGPVAMPETMPPAQLQTFGEVCG
ncbi:FAD-dependent oxidoreductase, partial [Streptomyces sp. NPDC041003]|uniref:FAD-dependent oxidoreductase n=1 Tax=Streptomyces sp. NPDC041003 TaxID=3155730 RepID=UPI0033FBBEA5